MQIQAKNMARDLMERVGILMAAQVVVPDGTAMEKGAPYPPKDFSKADSVESVRAELITMADSVEAGAPTEEKPAEEEASQAVDPEMNGQGEPAHSTTGLTNPILADSKTQTPVTGHSILN